MQDLRSFVVCVCVAGAAGCHGTVAFEGAMPIEVGASRPAPKPPPNDRAVLTESKIEIKEMVQFDVNSPVIKPESFGLLDEVAKIIKDHAELKRIAIEGHASSDGDDAQNLSLSDRRAKSVMTYLLGKGIEPSRLSAAGFGEARPIADNATEEGRIANRRVEFMIADRAAKQ
jgi:outer membrane protein OmpA-like peptidoglycan-associated protein